MNRTEAQHHTGAKAAALAQQMTAWLAAPAGMDQFPSDLVEWCRAARDTLAEVAAQAPTSYSPGEPGAITGADRAASRAAGDVPAALALQEDHPARASYAAPGMTLADFSLYAAEASGMLL